MSKLACLSFAPLLLALVACGGKASGAPNDDNGASGSGAGGTGAGGTGHAGSGGDAAAACAKYDDESAAYVNVVLINKTDAPISIGQRMVTCGVAPLFQVADASGAALPTPGDCRVSCVGVRTEGAGGCAAICRFPTSVTLQPGEVRSTTWDGLYSVQAALPASCLPFNAGEPMVSCDQAKQIAPGEYTFVAVAGANVDCSQTGGADSCPTCAPDGNGGCSTPGSLIGGKIITASTTVVLDGSYGIYGSADAAGNPNPGAGAGPNGNVALATVTLVFEN